MDTKNPAPLIFLNKDGVVTGWSVGAELILGWAEAEVVGKPLASLRNGSAFRTRNGALVELVLSSVAAPQEQTVVALYRPERLTLQERLDLTLSNADILGTWDWDVSKDIVVADQRFADAFGVAVDQARRGLPLEAFIGGIHADDQERVKAAISLTLQTGQPFRDEYRIHHIDGSIRDVVAHGNLAPATPEGKILFPGVIFDITDKRSAERRAKVMEARYLSLFEMIDAGFCVIRMIRDADGRPVDYEFIEVNPAFVQQSGFENPVGRRMRDIAPNHEQYWFDIYGEVAQTQAAVQFESGAKSFNRWFDVHAFPIDGPSSGHVAVLFTDKTRQKDIELALRESEANFRSLSEALPNLVWTTDGAGKLTWFNKGALDFSGRDTAYLATHGLRTLIHRDDRAEALRAWESARSRSEIFEAEYRMRRVDGEWRWQLARAVPVVDDQKRITRWIGTNTDIEHTKRNEAALANLNATLEQRIEERTAELTSAQRALQQSQKMEILGQLTGGVAHDFNNLLQIIHGNLQLLSRDVDHNERAGRRLANALSGVKRGAKLATQLLAFGRRQALEPRVINLGRLLNNMDDLLRRSIGEAVEVEVVVAGGLWNTEVDPGQFENAILNLVINARDAMEGAGQLTLEVCNASLDQDYARRHDELDPGQYVMVAVSDTGAGIPSAIMEKVFDPFFSTKPEGQGTGLGLSMVYGFVKQTGGHVKIYSETGQGTTVKIYLPRSYADEQREVAIDNGPVVGGSETILVVEDDDEVRATAVETLRDLGYRVLTARDAQSGLNVIESGVPIDVLFTDVVMPGPLKSRDMAKLAVAKLPGLIVLFTSGYTENSIVHGGKLDAGVELLSKPYTRESLARRLRSLLANKVQVKPALALDVQPERQPASIQPASDDIRVLLVEDEPLIRFSAAEMLADFGYVVTDAGTGSEALQVLNSTVIDVLVVDMGLPDLSGAEVAAKARQLMPDLAVVFATGSRVAPAHIPRAVLLPKPYNDADLNGAIEKALLATKS